MTVMMVMDVGDLVLPKQGGKLGADGDLGRFALTADVFV